MSEIPRQLADYNVGSQQNSNSSDDKSTTVFDSRKMELKEVIMIRRLQHLLAPNMLEPWIGKVVKEEVELVLERMSTAMNQYPGNEIHDSEIRNLELRFQNKLSVPVLTGKTIKGEDDSPIKIALVNIVTGEIVKEGPEASAKVEIVALKEDRDVDEGHDWTEINLKTVSENKVNRSLDTANVILNLKEGSGSVGEIAFTHRSSWMRRSWLRLEARIVGNFNGIRVREAKSEPFILEDCRSKYLPCWLTSTTTSSSSSKSVASHQNAATLYKKHYPPSLSDEVWRLENVGRRGPLVKRLKKGNIKNVKEFLTAFFINPQQLRNILGSGMSDKKLNDTVEHGLTCKLGNKYVYHPPNSQQKNGIVFNEVGQLVGKISECQYVPIDDLSDIEKADAQKLVVSEFERRGKLVCFDENSLLVPMLESPGGSNVGTSHITAGHDYTLPSTSVGIVSYSNSIARTSSDDFFSHFLSDMEFRGVASRIPSQDPDHQQFDSISTIQDPELQLNINNSIARTSFDDFFSHFLSDMEFLGETSGIPSQDPDHRQFDSISMIQDSEPRFNNNNYKARHKRWFKMSVVLKFSLRKKIVDSGHVQKKRRFH